jgi:hypothetical protein
MKHPLFWGTIVGIVVVCLLFLFAHRVYGLDLDLWFAYTGVVVASIGFGFGAYFIALAVDAYTQLNEIRKSTADIKEHMRDIDRARTEIEDQRHYLSRTAKELEAEAFNATEALMGAMLEYVQNVPGADENRKAAKKLLNASERIRAKYTCRRSTDQDKVSSSALLLVDFKDKSAIPCLEIAKKNFADRTDFAKILDGYIKHIEEK